MSQLDLILPDWDAPESIFACSSTRSGGISEGGFSSLNLASHVGDEPAKVDRNRFLLKQQLDLPGEPEWLDQTHSTRVVNLDHDQSRDADACLTTSVGKVAVVLTADCLPVLFCNEAGNEIAAAHAGWRGLLNGVLEHTVQSLSSKPENLLAWMGPAIGPRHFEVGAEVRRAFLELDGDQMSDFFEPTGAGHYLANLYAIAQTRLKNLGIKHISGGQFCTYAEPARFFSYRRENKTGRQASLIYIKH